MWSSNDLPTLLHLLAQCNDSKLEQIELDDLRRLGSLCSVLACKVNDLIPDSSLAPPTIGIVASTPLCVSPFGSPTSQRSQVPPPPPGRPNANNKSIDTYQVHSPSLGSLHGHVVPTPPSISGSGIHHSGFNLSALTRHAQKNGKKALTPMGGSVFTPPTIEVSVRRASDLSVLGSNSDGLNRVDLQTLGIQDQTISVSNEIAANQFLVTDVVHHTHVSSDLASGQYNNIPDEWKEKLNQIRQQFGVDPSKVETARLGEYKSRIPRILIFLKDQLIKKNGLEAVGIFRIAPDADDCMFIKNEIDAGRWLSTCKNGDVDCHIYANLIKVYFRDLPRKILSGINIGLVNKLSTEADAGSLMHTLPEPASSLFLWLLDLFILVSSQQFVNKMTIQNLAICFGPNLCDTDHLDPFEAIQFSQKICSFLHRASLYHLEKNKILPS